MIVGLRSRGRTAIDLRDLPFHLPKTNLERLAASRPEGDLSSLQAGRDQPRPIFGWLPYKFPYSWFHPTQSEKSRLRQNAAMCRRKVFWALGGDRNPWSRGL